MGEHRCTWAGNSEPYISYHDTEWGVPRHDDQKLFEMVNLEGAQAGLSWITILKKRAHYLEAFDQFDAHKIIHYSDEKLAELKENPGIIRNKLKIKAVVSNARSYLQIIETHGSFDHYLWDFVNGQPIINEWTSTRDVPATTPLSDTLSKDLKQRGFKFMGSTICYAFMQAIGMVNDHTTDCFRWKACGGK